MTGVRAWRAVRAAAEAPRSKSETARLVAMAAPVVQAGPAAREATVVTAAMRSCSVVLTTMASAVTVETAVKGAPALTVGTAAMAALRWYPTTVPRPAAMAAMAATAVPGPLVVPARTAGQ